MAKIPTSRPMIFVPSREGDKTDVYSLEEGVDVDLSELGRLVRLLDPNAEIVPIEGRRGMLRARISLGAYATAVENELISPSTSLTLGTGGAPQLKVSGAVPIRKLGLMLVRLENRIRSANPLPSGPLLSRRTRRERGPSP